MGLFSSNKVRIDELRSEIMIAITQLANHVSTLETHLTSLRGLVNRKLGNTGENALPSRQSDLEELKKAFGGVLPVEFEKFGEQQNS